MEKTQVQTIPTGQSPDDNTVAALVTNQGQDTTKVLQDIQSSIQQYAIYGVLLSAVVVVVMIAHMIQKMRVNHAIISINKNVQKLVDAQLTEPVKNNDSDDTAPVTQDNSDASKHVEQN